MVAYKFPQDTTNYNPDKLSKGGGDDAYEIDAMVWTSENSAAQLHVEDLESKNTWLYETFKQIPYIYETEERERSSGDVGFVARHSSAEHLIATKALRCTATAWMLTVAESFAKC